MSKQETLNFDGDTFDPKQDGERLSKQLVAVRELMMDGEWRTLKQIAKAVKAPEASVSARLRDLRKEKFGAWNVGRRRVPGKNGLYEYRVTTLGRILDEIRKGHPGLIEAAVASTPKLDIEDCEVKVKKIPCALE